MAESPAAVTIDPKALEDARTVWRGFTQMVKWSVIVVAVTLILIGMIFIDW